MTLSNQSILGVSITTSTEKQILSYCSSVFLRYTKTSMPITIVTPNPEQIVLAQSDETFRSILNSASVALPDGAGVVWAISRRRKSDIGYQTGNTSGVRNPKSVIRIPGVDFMVELCRMAARKHGRVFLYGGRNGTAARALKALQTQIPGLDGIAEDGEEFQMTNDKSQITNQIQITNNQNKDIAQHIAQVVRSRNIKIVFIGLGAPKQEYLMDKIRSSFIVHRSWKHQHKITTNYERQTMNSFVLMVVGGAFDMLAGNVTRAPKGVQAMGLEWLWRLCQEPWRLGRQLSLLKFLWLAAVKK